MHTDIKVGELDAYLSAPDSGVHPGLIVIHEIWGLNAHTKDVADRYAAEGYVVLAPELLAQTGITEKISPEILSRMQNPETRDEAQKEMRAATAPLQSPEFGKETVERLQQCYNFLSSHESTTGTVAILGFCFGGTYSFKMATAQPDLACAIPFYGHSDPEDAPASDVPILAFYGEQDTGLVNELPTLEAAMQKANRDFEYKVYPNTGHAFFNDTNHNMYNAEASADAWEKSLAFLARHTSKAGMAM